MGKKAIIEIALVDECYEKSNNVIAQEIFQDLTEWRTTIPWCKKVEKVVVLGKNEFY
jgi:hypothetical protein